MIGVTGAIRPTMVASSSQTAANEVMSRRDNRI